MTSTTNIPTFNEYAAEQYQGAISRGVTNRKKAMRYAAEQATLAMKAGMCSDPDFIRAATDSLMHYDDSQGRKADEIIACLAEGRMDTPEGMNSIDAMKTIAILGNGVRKTVQDLTADDLDAMVEARNFNALKARRTADKVSHDVDTISPAVKSAGNVGKAFASGAFKVALAFNANLSGAKGKRIVSKPKGADA